MRGFETELFFQGLTAIQTIRLLHPRRNSPTAVSEGGSGRLKSKMRTENEEFSKWKMAVAAVQLSGKDFCGRGGRRDADVSLPDMFNFSFSWPRKLSSMGCVQILVR